MENITPHCAIPTSFVCEIPADADNKSKNTHWKAKLKKVQSLMNDAGATPGEKAAALKKAEAIACTLKSECTEDGGYALVVIRPNSEDPNEMTRVLQITQRTIPWWGVLANNVATILSVRVSHVKPIQRTGDEKAYDNAHTYRFMGEFWLRKLRQNS